MVAHGHWEFTGPQLHIRLDSPCRRDHRPGEVFYFQSRSRRHDHHRLRLRLHGRPTFLGTLVRILRSSTDLHHLLLRLYLLASRMCALEKHRIDLGLPIPERLFRRCTSHEFRRAARRYMGFGSSRSGDEHVCSRPLRGTIRRTDRGRLHRCHGNELAMGLLDPRDLRRGLPRHHRVLCPGDIRSYYPNASRSTDAKGDGRGKVVRAL